MVLDLWWVHLCGPFIVYPRKSKIQIEPLPSPCCGLRAQFGKKKERNINLNLRYVLPGCEPLSELPSLEFSTLSYKMDMLIFPLKGVL